MATTFTTSQANLVKYWYEKLPYTSLITSLSTGQTSIFSVNDISAATSGSKLAVMSDIATTQTANVSLTIGHPDSTVQVATSAYPASLAPTESDEDGGVRSTRKLSLGLVNSSGGAVANFQTNYSVAVKQLSVADKVLRGITLTHDDQVLQNKYSIGRQGIRPNALSEQLKRAFKGSILDEIEYAYSQTVTAGQTTTIDAYRANAGEILVLTSVAANATLGNQVQLNISRDSDESYAQVLADNMSLSQPLSVWLPATRTLSITATANTTTNNVTVRVKVLRVKYTTLLRAMFGDLNPALLSGEDKNIYDSVRAGVLV